MTELITAASGAVPLAARVLRLRGNRGPYCTVPRSVASGGLEFHRDPGGPLRRRGQRGDESFGCFAIAASGHDAGGIGGCHFYWCRPVALAFSPLCPVHLSHLRLAHSPPARPHLF